MLLQRLNEYADRLALPPTLYSEAPVRYACSVMRRASGTASSDAVITSS